MTRTQHLLSVQLVTLVVLTSLRSSLADYVGSNGYAPVRIRDNGTVAPPTYDVSNFSCQFSCFVESPAPQIALSPDSTIVYGLGTSLGVAFDILSWNTNTGQLGSDGFLITNPNDYIYTEFVGNRPQPIVRRNELFALGPVYSNGSYSTTSWQVKRYSFTTDSLIENINPPTPQVLHDIAFDQVGNLYVAGTSGIYEYTHRYFPPVFDTYQSVPSNPIVTGVDGNIAIGPDNLMYVRNSATGDVQRYTTSGLPLGTFISHTAFPNLGTIQFGPDGNLHAYQTGASPNILTFNGLTGSLLFSTPAAQIQNGRIFYLVPEPSASILLFAVIIACLLSKSRSIPCSSICGHSSRWPS